MSATLPPPLAPYPPEPPPLTRRPGIIRDRYGPSVPDLVFIFLAVAIPFALTHRLLNADGDVARHLTIGEWILAHRGLPARDVFSFTRAGEPFLAFEWGSEVVYALAARIGGLPAVAIFAGFLLALTYALVALFLRRRGVDPLLAYLLAIGAAVLGGPHYAARPHLFTLLGAVLLVWLLESRRRRAPWIALPLFIVWANLHGGWIYGLVLIGIYCVGDALEWLAGGDAEYRPRLWQHALTFGLAAVGTLLNPYGARLHGHLLGFFGGSNYLLDVTDEFLSPDFHDINGKILAGVLLMMMLMFAFTRRRPSWPRLLVVLAGIWFALYARRNMPLLGVTALPLLALEYDPEWRALRLRGLDHVREVFATGDRGRLVGIWSGVVAAALLLLAVNGGSVAGVPLVSARFDARDFPVQAVARARAAGLEGRVFNDLSWGGYLLYAWPEQRVFIDGGTDHYGEELTRDYVRVIFLQPGWRELLDRYGITMAILPASSPLAAEIAREPGWRVWHRDPTAVVLLR